jgi:hypothetical protein
MISSTNMQWIGLVILAVLMVLMQFLNLRNRKNKDLTAEIRQAAYALFAQAEAMNLIGPDLIKWVVEQLYIKYPQLSTFLKQQTAEEWAQSLYKQFKNQMVENPQPPVTLVAPATPVVPQSPDAPTEK